MRILASDIGGTSARFGVFDLELSGREPLIQRTYESRRFDGLVPAVERFLDDLGGPVPDRACFAVAGPVVDGEAEVTNLDWDLREADVRDSLGIPDVRLINDFLAIGHGIAWLRDEDVAELQAGDPVDEGPVGLLGPGTGLGYAFVLKRDGVPRVHASEGGHVEFAPRNEMEMALLGYLKQRLARVSCERVVSGPGLLNIYRFLVDTGFGPEDPEVARAADAPAAISTRGMEGAHPVSAKALDMFVSAFGSMAGDLALTIKATGGIYLAGGISPKILPKLREGDFLEAFRTKGRLSEIPEAAPVRVILDPGVGLLGAAAAGSM